MSRRIARRVRLQLEALEDRCLPSGITEFAAGITANSDPNGITTGSDGNLWFTELTGRIGRITPTGMVTEFAIPTVNSNPRAITAGSDGNLWFTEGSGNKIGRITPTGTITEFDVPTAFSSPEGITAGPDGNLWFTEQGTDKIGRCTPTGTITDFPVLTSSSQPSGITAGPDGNLWFTENVGNSIGRITPTGTVTEFSSGLSANAFPTGITAGPDGNLWFAEFGPAASGIGRITPTGTITEFRTFQAHQVLAITAAADGNLWYTGGNVTRSLGRITPGRAVSEFAIPSGSFAPAIAAGPDGNVWFAEDASKIARANLLTLSAFPFSFVANQPYSDTVATVSALDPGTTTADLQATINWGDNTTTAGVITGTASSGFSISGTHTYTQSRAFTAVVTVTNIHNPPGLKLAPDTVSVSEPVTVQTVFLSNSSVLEFRPNGTVVGTLTTTGVNPSDTVTYSLVSGPGSTDNASFAIAGNQLVTADAFNSVTNPSYIVRVRSTDNTTSQVQEQVFRVTILKDPMLSWTPYVLTITATAFHEDFSYTPGAAQIQMTVGSVALAADYFPEVLEVVFQGIQGRGTATLHGFAGMNNNWTLQPNNGFLSTRDFTAQVAVNNVAQIVVYSAAATDIANFYDSTSGGNTFVSTAGESYEYGPGYFNAAVGFPTSVAYAKGPNDFAQLFDVPGNNSFTGTATSAYLQAPTFFGEAVNYAVVVAQSVPGASDSATLFDAAGTNNFVGLSTEAYLYGTGYFLGLAGFKGVVAYRVLGSNDTATLFGGPGNTTLQAFPTYTYLQGSDYTNEAAGFQVVVAYNAAGASGGAYLHGAGSGDVFTFLSGSMESSLQGSGFLIAAVGFQGVSLDEAANSVAASLTDSFGGASLIGRADAATLLGSGYTISLNGVRSLTASSSGGAGHADIQDVGYPYTLLGNWQ